MKQICDEKYKNKVIDLDIIENNIKDQSQENKSLNIVDETLIESNLISLKLQNEFDDK